MKKHRQMVQKSWDQQRWEKEARRKEEQQQENERLKREAEDNALKDMVSAEQMEKKRNQVMEWKEAVLQQIQDLKAKQREEVELENTMRREREKRFILEEMEDKRRRLLEKRKNLDLG